MQNYQPDSKKTSHLLRLPKLVLSVITGKDCQASPPQPPNCHPPPHTCGLRCYHSTEQRPALHFTKVHWTYHSTTALYCTTLQCIAQATAVHCSACTVLSQLPSDGYFGFLPHCTALYCKLMLTILYITHHRLHTVNYTLHYTLYIIPYKLYYTVPYTP